MITKSLKVCLVQIIIQYSSKVVCYFSFNRNSQLLLSRFNLVPADEDDDDVDDDDGDTVFMPIKANDDDEPVRIR